MNALTGTGSLTWLALRRDRFKLPAYVLGLSLLTLGMLAGIGGQDRQALVDEAELFASTPAMRIFGVASGASEGATTMIRGYLLLAVLAALMSALSVVRHTRQNEETGRAELVGAAVVGRHAGLTAALIVTVGGNVALAVAIGAAGIVAGQPTLGSFTVGMATGALGIVFAGVAAVAVQIFSTTRGASGFAAAVLGLAFVVSGVGNMLGQADASGLRLESAWPAWLSALGWGQQMRPFGGDSWWPLGLFLIAFIVLAGAASMLATRRDFGSGILAQRRGQAEASPRLLSPFGLVWQLQRNALLGWTVAMAGFGLVFGAIIDEMKDLEGAAADWYARMGGSEHILDAYQASVTEMAGMAVAIYAVQILLRMRAEEADGRLEVRSRCVGEPTALAVESPPQRRAGCAPLAPRLRSEHGPRRRCRTGRCPGRAARTDRSRARPAPGHPADRGPGHRPRRVAAASSHRILLGCAHGCGPSGPCSAPPRCSCRPGRKTSRHSPTRRSCRQPISPPSPSSA